MATQRYSVTPHPIETLLTWLLDGEIPSFDDFLDQRRNLMAQKINTTSRVQLGTRNGSRGARNG